MTPIIAAKGIDVQRAHSIATALESLCRTLAFEVRLLQFYGQRGELAAYRNELPFGTTRGLCVAARFMRSLAIYVQSVGNVPHLTDEVVLSTLQFGLGLNDSIARALADEDEDWSPNYGTAL